VRKLLLGLATFLIFGVVALRFTVETGVRQFANADARIAAEQAYAEAWRHRDNPLQRIVSPAASVVALATLPGNCPTGDSTPPPAEALPPDGAALTRDPALAAGDTAQPVFAAQVRFYTLFGIPVGDVYVACGSVTETPPDGWPGVPVQPDKGVERDLRFSGRRQEFTVRHT